MRTVARTPAPALTFPAAALELPVLDGAPRSRTVYMDSPVSARAALALLDAGLIDPDAKGNKPGELVHQALKRWLDQLPQRFGATLTYEEIALATTEKIGAPGVKLELTDYRKAEAYGFYRNERETRTCIGPKLDRAETMIPGLGQTTLILLGEASDASLPLLLPQTLFDMARLVYWGGAAAETNKQKLADLAAQNRGRRPGRELVTARMFHHAIPKCFCQPERRLGRPALDHLAAKGRPDLIRTLAKALVALEQALEGKPRTTHDRPPLMYAGRVAFESYGFQTMERRVIDDYTNKFQRDHAMGESRTGYLMKNTFRVNEPSFHANLVGFFKRLDPSFPILVAADRVLDVLADRRDNERSPF